VFAVPEQGIVKMTWGIRKGLKRNLGRAAFHRSSFSLKWLFIEAAFHQNAFSSKQLFIESSHRWIIHQMNE
jgi:hypothetical protein